MSMGELIDKAVRIAGGIVGYTWLINILFAVHPGIGGFALLFTFPIFLLFIVSG